MRLLPFLLLFFSCVAWGQSGSFIWPTQGKVINEFDPTRKGIDIAGKAGQPVVAASDGKVLYASNMRGYGNLIILEHSDSMVTAYAHNKIILVREGQTVKQGQQIAEMGDSDADTIKLRFQIRHMGKPLDPMTLLPVSLQNPVIARIADAKEASGVCELFISKTVKSNTSFPDMPAPLVVTVRIKLSTNRLLVDVKIVFPSDNPAFDRQIERGIRKSGQFPAECPEDFVYRHALNDKPPRPDITSTSRKDPTSSNPEPNELAGGGTENSIANKTSNSRQNRFLVYQNNFNSNSWGPGISVLDGARIVNGAGPDGSSAAYFDGDYDGLILTNSDLNFGSNDFELSFKMRADGSQDAFSVLFSRHLGGDYQTGKVLEIANMGSPSPGSIEFTNGKQGFAFSNKVNINDGAWHQINISRVGSVVTATTDGVHSVSSSISPSTEINLNGMRIGRWQGNNFNDNNFKGYIDDIVVTRSTLANTDRVDVERDRQQPSRERRSLEDDNRRNEQQVDIDRERERQAENSRRLENEKRTQQAEIRKKTVTNKKIATPDSAPPQQRRSVDKNISTEARPIPSKQNGDFR